MTDRIDFGDDPFRQAVAELAEQRASVLCIRNLLASAVQESGAVWEPWSVAEGMALELEMALSEKNYLDPGDQVTVSPKPSNRVTENKRKPIPDSVRTAIYERDEYACVDCGTRKQLSIDHIIPVASGGSNDMENLRTLCRPCNSRKGAREMVE